jgi:antitoxin component YwqK of YwqJK toxin-antitoxin module
MSTHMNHHYINTSIICFMLLQSCHHTADEIAIPRVFVLAADPSLRHAEGVLYLGTAPFSGWVYSLYDKGDTASITSFYKGREHGTARAWYPNRQLKEIRSWCNGRKTGEHKGWWEDGRLRFIYHFSNDTYEGTVQEWYPGGQLYRNMHYHEGREEGMQQVWRPDGALHANYAAVNGRNYGLTGTLHCKNIFPRVP